MTLPDPIGDAVSRVGEGGLLAYPTETVWGLGADCRSEQAMERLRRWKGRGEQSPVAVLVETLEAAKAAGFEFGEAALELAARFWPGPLTLVVPGPGGLAQGVAREDGAVGVRCSSHPLAAAIARRLHRESGLFLTSTSLNHSGGEPAESVEQARALCGESPDEPFLLPVEGCAAGGDAASTVVDLTGDAPRVLRWGAVARSELEPALEELS